jgi:HK97 family phage major capsid protein
VTTRTTNPGALAAAIADRYRRAHDRAEHLARSVDNGVDVQLELEGALGDLRHYAEALKALDGVAVARSPYEPGSGHSLIADRLAERFDADAANRIRSYRQQQVTRATFEHRDIGTAAVGALVVPQYVIDQAAAVAGASAPLARILARPLTAKGSKVVYASWDTPPTAAAQATENTDVGETDLATSAAEATVRTYTAATDVSRQFLERARDAVDEVVLPELVAAVDEKIDADLLNGPGSGGRLTGILATAGIGTGTYTDASPTAAELIPVLAQAYATSAAARGLPPTIIAMHPRRWAKILEATDTAGRPLVDTTGTPRALDAGGTVTAAGTVIGLPVVVDANIPTNLGAGTNEDRVVLLRPDAWRVWVSEPTLEIVEEQAAPGTVRLLARRYVAAGPALASSVVAVGGTGLAV